MIEVKRRSALAKPIQFKLGDEVIEFSVPATASAGKFAEIQGKIVKLREINTPDAEAKIGEQIIIMMRLLFGNEATIKILNFFDANYSEMLTQIYPLIMKKIIPALRKESRKKARLYR